MFQKLPLDGFEWVKELSKFDEYFIKNYDEDSNKGCFLEEDVVYQKNCLIFLVIYHFYLKGIKFKNVISLFVMLMIRKTILFT